MRKITDRGKVIYSQWPHSLTKEGSPSGDCLSGKLAFWILVVTCCILSVMAAGMCSIWPLLLWAWSRGKFLLVLPLLRVGFPSSVNPNLLGDSIPSCWLWRLLITIGKSILISETKDEATLNWSWQWKKFKGKRCSWMRVIPGLRKLKQKGHRLQENHATQ